jgi:uncharacterized caspase-like protein
MVRALKICLMLLLPLSAGRAAFAEKRVALVIGNGAYVNASPLPNPKNDGEDMAAALRKLGFTVILGIDLDKRAMDAKILAFANALSGADTGVFHYSGHGLQVSGVNYLVPVDAELATPAALDFEAVRLDLVQRTMEREAKTNVLFLDACRNNPLARNLARALGTRSAEIGRGLAATEAGVGTLIGFSTQPGNVALDGSGRNSPYSGPLAKAIGTPGKDLSAILIAVRNEVLAATGEKQVPWEHSALRAPFYFQPGSPAVSAGPPQAAGPLGPDAQAWSVVQNTTSEAILEEFIRGFPDSVYVRFAKARIEELRRDKPKQTQTAVVTPPKPLSTIPPEKQTAAGAQAPVDIWYKLCIDVPTPNCLTQVDVRDNVTAILIGKFAIRKVAGQAKPQVLVMLPVNSNKSVGALVKIDDNEPVKLPITTCDQAGCYAEAIVDISFVDKLKAGKQVAYLGIENETGKALSIPLPLEGFAKAFNGPSIPIEKYNEDQKKIAELIRQRLAERANKK